MDRGAVSGHEPFVVPDGRKAAERESRMKSVRGRIFWIPGQTFPPATVLGLSSESGVVEGYVIAQQRVGEADHAACDGDESDLGGFSGRA